MADEPEDKNELPDDVEYTYVMEDLSATGKALAIISGWVSLFTTITLPIVGLLLYGAKGFGLFSVAGLVLYISFIFASE